MRPFATAVAIFLWAYAAFGMPWLDDASPLSEPFRQIIRVLCIGAVGMLMAVWIGGHSAPIGATVSRRWGAMQIATSIGLFFGCGVFVWCDYELKGKHRGD
jgi:multisubunit Na+/H+ antiporter MnhB subunit